MKRLLVSALALNLIATVAHAADNGAVSATAATPAMPITKAAANSSGIQAENIDPSVRPQDDFYRYAQGTWLKTTEIPADKSDWGAFLKAREDVQQQLRTLVENAAKNPSAKDANTQKIGDLYLSFMNEQQLDKLGLQPLDAELRQIAALKDKKDLATLVASMQKIGVHTPFHVDVGQDSKNSTAYQTGIYQSGLGLPNRDYYLNTEDPKLSDVRAKYLSHIERMFALAKMEHAAEKAQAVLKIETAIARSHWTNVENRDPVKTYNKLSIADLQKLTPDFDWNSYLQSSGFAGKTDSFVVAQPSYLSGLNQLIKETPVTAWQAYFEWQLLSGFSAYLPAAFVNENFAFKGKVLSGIKEMRTREQRGVALVDQSLGEAVGQLYVEKYFPDVIKVRTEKMVGYFLAAFKDSISKLDWMSEETRKQAQIKLSKISVKVGYPKTWRDYSAIRITRDDLIGNLKRISAAQFTRDLNRLGKPVDREEWHMTPQTVNAYYSPEMNEIVFPAARLQPPLFNVEAEDAFNYGALGISIGHEISHAFDDSGSQYDGDGNLRNWWTKEDREKFDAKTKILVEQYNGYSPVAGHYLNGKLTLGENIADNVGIVMALRAYKLSLEGKPAPVIDGWTAEQRLFMGLAQARRNKTREQRALALIKTDPHSPGEFRVNGSLRNHPDYYQTFNVKPGDKMYLPPEQRVNLW